MKAEQLRICGACDNVYNTKRRKRTWTGRQWVSSMGDAHACPKCNALNTTTLDVLVRNSAFFQGLKTL